MECSLNEIKDCMPNMNIAVFKKFKSMSITQRQMREKIIHGEKLANF